MSLLLRWLVSRDARGDAPHLSLVQGWLALRGIGFEQCSGNRRFRHSRSPHGSGQGREPVVAVLENLLRAAVPLHPHLGGSGGLRVGRCDPQRLEIGVDRPLIVRRYVDLAGGLRERLGRPDVEVP